MTDAKGCGKPLRRAATSLAVFVVLTAATALSPDARSERRPVRPIEWPGTAEVVHVAEALDGTTIRLVDERIVRLAGLRSPHPPLGLEPAAGAAAGLTERARVRLAALVADRSVTIHVSGMSHDRYDRLVAHAVRQDGLWFQEALVAEGLAVVMPLPGSDDTLLRSLMVAERGAREAQLGLWADHAFRVRTPDDAGAAVDAYRIVEGVVHSVAEVRGRTYLNFGEDWRTDFTVTIAPADRDAFEAAGLSLVALQGIRVRARGWLANFNGPLIEASHTAQIEVLHSAAPPTDTSPPAISPQDGAAEPRRFDQTDTKASCATAASAKLL